MNDTRFYIIVGIILLVGGVLFARGMKDTAPAKRKVQITGTVRLVGNNIFPEIVITTKEGEWYIVPDEMEKLHNLQHRTVTVEGEETVEQLTFAGGLPAGKRYELSNVVVLTVSNEQ